HPHFQVARARGFDASSTLTAMDIEGIDVAVMYGTRGRQVLCHDDLKPDYAAALARAYNNWAADYCKTDPMRLKFAAQVAMHDVKSAVEEARRSVTELGAVAIVGTPNPVNGQHLHDQACERSLSMLPSEYFRRQCYIALDVDEEPAVDVVNKMGAGYFVVSSDYPHSDGAFPEAIEQFLGLPLGDEQRRKILWDNCARL